jgi:1-deoxy-D-xylulose-5-phosphate reductoisomerase
VDVVIHPQSKVHAMIEYSDGSVLAQISATDMRMPIQYALTYPSGARRRFRKIDWSEARQWEFLPPDFQKFPLLQAGLPVPGDRRIGHLYVERRGRDRRGSLLERRIGYPSIYEIVSETLSKMPERNLRTVGDILEMDRESRRLARELIAARAAGPVTV